MHTPSQAQLAAASHPHTACICSLLRVAGSSTHLSPLRAYSLTVADMLLLQRHCSSVEQLAGFVKQLDILEAERDLESIRRFLIARLRSIENILQGKSTHKIQCDLHSF